MSLIDLKLGGLVGLSVGSLAVSAYAGSVNQIGVEIIGAFIAVISGMAYFLMQVDRYLREV